MIVRLGMLACLLAWHDGMGVRAEDAVAAVAETAEEVVEEAATEESAAAEEPAATEEAATEEPTAGETEEAASSEEMELDAGTEEAAAAEEPAPAPAAEAAAAEPEPAPEPEPEPEPAAEPEVEVAVEEAPEEAPAPAPAESPVFAAPPALPALAPPPVMTLPAWSTRAQAEAFDAFIRCGLPSDGAGQPAGLVLGLARPHTGSAIPGDEILISGIHPRGQMFVAYRERPESCGLKFAGLLVVHQSAGPGATRGVVKRVDEPLRPGDQLYSYDAIREEFLAQRAGAAAGRPPTGLKATVRCMGDQRTVIASRHEVLLVDRGSSDGVSWGALFMMDVPGTEGGRTAGRVIRAGAKESYVLLQRVYQPVRVGDQLALVAEPAAATTRSARAAARKRSLPGARAKRRG